MNSRRTTAVTLLKSLIALVLVFSLTSCGEKAVSQEPSASFQQNPEISTKQFSEVAPPIAIQELRQTTDLYRPQVLIISPKPDEILQDNIVTVRFQVKDLPIYKDSKLNLGPHLQVILDNQPAIAVYDLNQPLVLSDLSPGTHTLRVFASRPWHESYKNEGAYAQTTFHVFTKSDSNNPDPALPLLTYNRPDGNYGAEPILLDFYLTNAPLHLLAKDNPDNPFADWRIRCTINGESFVLDRWQAVYLKGFKPGKNWVKLEFLDNQGNPVKNEFNSTVRLLTYEPKGKDTLSKIVRGELSADQVRTIVDPNYTTKLPTVEPTPVPTATPTVEPIPEIQPKEEKQPVPEIEPKPIPTATPTVEPIPEIQPKEEKQPVPEIEPTPIPTVIPTVEPTLEPQPQEEKQAVPETEPQPVPQTQPKKSRFGGFFNRRAGKKPTPQPTVEASPSLPPTLPEMIETPASEKTEEPQLDILPEADPQLLPQKVAPQPEHPELGRYFNRRQYPNAAPSPSLPYAQPKMIQPSVPEQPSSETQNQS
ncbi:hypothetical protein [Fischerella sp. JS2]|uniref:hypothetical protein n=1 Tax=Fischerella sp. JS2 TaxID=2597771 RepID=UPI0028EB0E8C|nr:hypothetical protein [Fischerella sp. JS2]